MVKVLRTNILIPVGIAHVQYESTNVYYLEVMIHVNFKKGQMSRSKGLVPTKNLITRNIHELALTVQKLLARLKFSKYGSNSKVMVTG